MSDDSPAGEPAAGPLIELLRLISRDVAHELRGPVQSIVVNLEVLRRKSLAGDPDAVAARADVIEEETHRLHALVEAFVALLRAPRDEPVNVGADSLLGALSPLFEVIAKGARIRVDPPAAPATALLRLRPEPARLALLRAFVAARDAAGPEGAITIASVADEHHVAFRFEARPPAAAGNGPVGEPLRLAFAAIAHWTEEAGGTAGLEPGSDTRHTAVALRLPRAT